MRDERPNPIPRTPMAVRSSPLTVWDRGMTSPQKRQALSPIRRKSDGSLTTTYRVRAIRNRLRGDHDGSLPPACFWAVT
jgi:hypothetical protein